MKCQRINRDQYGQSGNTVPTVMCYVYVPGDTLSVLVRIWVLPQWIRTLSPGSSKFQRCHIHSARHMAKYFNEYHAHHVSLQILPTEWLAHMMHYCILCKFMQNRVTLCCLFQCLSCSQQGLDWSLCCVCLRRRHPGLVIRWLLWIDLQPQHAHVSIWHPDMLIEFWQRVSW